MTILNISLICLSLKYINKNYNLISNVSKWFYLKLTELNYKEEKFIDSLIDQDFEIIEVLIKFNQNVNLLSQYLIEYSSCSNNYINIIKLLIENGADIHIQNDYALRAAIINSKFEKVKLLIDNGANIHVDNNHALRLASTFGKFKVVKLLIDNGADIHALNDYALRYASHNGYFEVVKFLIDNGADIHAKNDFALKCAKKNEFSDIVKLLIDNKDESYKIELN